MKNWSLLFVMLLVNLLAAQPIITNQSYPVDGEEWIEYYDSTSGKYNIGAEGANITWDFSSGFVANDSIHFNFVNPNTTPYNWQNDFPNANIAIYVPADSAAFFYTSADSGFFQNGGYISYSGVTTTMKIDPPLRIIKGNLAYGDTFISYTKSVMLFYNGQMTEKAIHYNYRAGKADAWGSLKTAVGNFSNALRARYWEWSIDTTYIDSTGSGNWEYLYSNGPSKPRLSYEWYIESHPFFVMGANMEELDQSVIRDLTVIKGLPVSIEKSTKEIFSFYPNPANDFICINKLKMENEYLVQIYDTNGKLVINESFSNTTIKNIDVKNFSNGIYLLRMIDKTSDLLQSRKIAINK